VTGGLPRWQLSCWKASWVGWLTLLSEAAVDLRTIPFVDGDEATSGTSRLHPSSRAVLANAAVVLSVTGGLIYGLVALGYDRFYRTLGIAPEDVGLDQRRIIAHTAIAMALFFSALGGLFAFTYAALSWFLQRSSPTTVLLISVALLAILGPVLLGLTTAPILFESPYVGTTLGVAAAVLLAVITSIWLKRRAGTTGRKRALVLMWAAVVAVVYVASVDFATARMGGLASRVIAGSPIPPAGLTFTFDVHADPVCVRDGTAVFYALYLGDDGDRIALYQPSKGRTIRRSRTGLELSFIPADTSPIPNCG